MGRRWTEQDICELKRLSRRYSAPKIAELTDRTVGGIVFKAYRLKLSLRTSRRDAAGGAARPADAPGDVSGVFHDSGKWFRPRRRP